MDLKNIIDDAIQNRRTITIKYQKYGGEYSERTISNIQPSEEFGEGYIKAYCHLRHEDRTFKINRIVSILDSNDSVLLVDSQCEVKESRRLNQVEYNNIDSAIITNSTSEPDKMLVQFNFKSGATTSIPLSRTSTSLKEGNKIDLSSIVIQTLHKEGSPERYEIDIVEKKEEVSKVESNLSHNYKKPEDKLHSVHIEKPIIKCHYCGIPKKNNTSASPNHNKDNEKKYICHKCQQELKARERDGFSAFWLIPSIIIFTIIVTLLFWPMRRSNEFWLDTLATIVGGVLWGGCFGIPILIAIMGYSHKFFRRKRKFIREVDL